MHGFGFSTLALLAAVGFAGPLLASVPRLRIPAMIGELIAGIVIGNTGFGLVDVTDPMFALLANIGFALVMFVVGSHVPVRGPKMRAAVPMASARAVLMASSSAAMTLPMIDSLRLHGPQVLSVTAQIAIANAACIVLLSLAIDPRQAPKAALGGLAITGCAVVLYLLLRAFDRKGWHQRLHHYSHDDELVLELRINLLVLFGLAILAVNTGVSKYILLGAGLGLGDVLAHCVARLLGQPITFAVMSSTQLGVAVAAATIGTQEHLLAPGEASALMFGSLLTIAATSIAGTLVAQGQPAAPPDEPVQTPLGHA